MSIPVLNFGKFQSLYLAMGEYANLLAKNGIRFTGASVTLSPQLEDFGLQNVLHPVSSERNVPFRVVLHVPFLEPHEVRIVFPTDDTLEVHMEHGPRNMGKRQRGIPWSRDCRYVYRLPEGIGRDRLTAMWTDDSFLVIQSRGQRPLLAARGAEGKGEAQQLIPSKVCGVLRPHLNLSILKDMLRLHGREVDEIREYMETSGTVREDRDVFGLLKNHPGKPKCGPEDPGKPKCGGPEDPDKPKCGSDDLDKPKCGPEEPEKPKCGSGDEAKMEQKSNLK